MIDSLLYFLAFCLVLGISILGCKSLEYFEEDDKSGGWFALTSVLWLIAMAVLINLEK